MNPSLYLPIVRNGVFACASLVALFAGGCGTATSSAPAPGGELAQGPPSSEVDAFSDGAAPRADDVEEEAENPLVRGIQQALRASPLAEEATGLEDDLEEADDLLSRAKQSNREALREANRQVRLRNHGSPNVLFIVAEGVSRDALGVYGAADNPTVHLDAFAQAGVRFTNFTAPWEEDIYWRRLLTGQRTDDVDELPRGRVSTLSALMWQGGYTTHLIGDCSAGGLFANVDPREFEFDDWAGLRDQAALDDSFPDVLEAAGGATLQVSANANGKEGISAGKLFTNVAKAQLARLLKGRPFFMIVAYPRHVANDVKELDAAVGELMAELDKLKLSRHTVVIFTGTGDKNSATVPAIRHSAPAPMIVRRAGQQPPGVVSSHAWDVADVLPTLADAVSAIHRPRSIEGRSMWPEVRQPQPESPIDP